MIEEMAQEYPPAARATRQDFAEAFPIWSQIWPAGDSLFAIEHTRWASPADDPEIAPGVRVWRVFSVSGRYAGVVRFPAGFGYPYRVEDRRVIGIRRDAMGVATIESYEVERR